MFSVSQERRNVMMCGCDYIPSGLADEHACTLMLSRSLWLSGILAWKSKSGISTSVCHGHVTSWLPAVGWKEEC